MVVDDDASSINEFYVFVFNLREKRNLAWVEFCVHM